MAFLYFLITCLKISMFVDCYVIDRQSSSFESMQSKPCNQVQKFFFHDSLIPVNASENNYRRVERNVESSGLTEIKSILTKSKGIMERMEADPNLHQGEINDQEILSSRSREEELKETIYDDLDNFDEPDKSGHGVEDHKSTLEKNNPNDEVETIFINEGSGASEVEIPIPKTAAIISDTDHLFSKEEGMAELYKELNGDDSLDLNTDDNNKQDNSLRVVGRDDELPHPTLLEVSNEEGSGDYSPIIVPLGEGRQDMSAPIIDDDDKNVELMLPNSAEKAAENEKKEISENENVDGSEDVKSGESFLDPEINTGETVAESELDQAGNGDSSEGVGTESVGKARTLEEEIIKSSGSDLYAVDFEDNDYKSSHREENESKSKELSEVDLFFQGAAGTLLEKQTAVDNDTTKEDDQELGMSGQEVTELESSLEHVTIGVSNEGHSEKDVSIHLDMVPNEEISPTTEKEDSSYKEGPLEVDQDSTTQEFFQVEEITSTLPTQQEVNRSEDDFEVTVVPEINEYEDISTTIEPPFSSTVNLEKRIIEQELAQSGESFSTTEVISSTETSTTIGDIPVEVPVPVEPFAASTEAPIVTSPTTIEIAGRDDDKITEIQLQESTTEPETETTIVEGVVLVESSLRENIKSQESEILSGGAPDDKSLGAYIIIGLIGISFLALIVFLVLRKRSRGQKARLDNNQDRDPEKSLLSNGKYKEDSDENNVKNNEIAPLVIKQNSQINKFEKNPNFSSPKNLNTTANEKNVEKDNVLKSTQAIIEDDEDAKKAIDDEKKPTEEIDGIDDERKALMGEDSPTEKVVVRTHLDQDSIPKRPVLVTRNGNGYHSVSQVPI